MSTVTIDAQGKILGRLASQIAMTLRGKHLPSYRPDRLAEVTVIVTHVDQMKVSGRKIEQKMYYHFSGYPGGLKSTRLAEVMSSKPDWVLRQAVRRMLPTNRLRDRLLKHLRIEST